MLDSITRYFRRRTDRSEPALEEASSADAGGGFASGGSVAASPRRHPREFASGALDAEAVKVIRRLTEAGHEAYLVGGCVRDLLFGLQPKDFDVVASAHPPEIKRMFRNCRIIGRRFRLAHVYFRDKVIEVATFRSVADSPSEGASSELLIRDDNIFGTAEQDAARRDFTINALFYDVDRREIIDFIGGVHDAEHKVVRTIGDPQIRMREDPIRMLRAIRLASRLGCTIDADTWSAIRDHREEILDAAAPRIGDELLRMYRGAAMAPAFDLMLASGVLRVVLPELHRHIEDALGTGSSEELDALRSALRHADRWTQSRRPLTPAVRMALLLSPVLLTPAQRRGSGDPAQRVTERLRPIAQRLAISKRDAERIRLVLLAQDKLAPRRRGRRSGGALVRRAYFPEALDLFELLTEATGDFKNEAARWRKRLGDVYPDGVPEPRRRPARRPRRRRREHGEKGARTG